MDIIRHHLVQNGWERPSPRYRAYTLPARIFLHPKHLWQIGRYTEHEKCYNRLGGEIMDPSTQTLLDIIFNWSIRLRIDENLPLDVHDSVLRRGEDDIDQTEVLRRLEEWYCLLPEDLQAPPDGTGGADEAWDTLFEKLARNPPKDEYTEGAGSNTKGSEDEDQWSVDADRGSEEGNQVFEEGHPNTDEVDNRDRGSRSPSTGGHRVILPVAQWVQETEWTDGDPFDEPPAATASPSSIVTNTETTASNEDKEEIPSINKLSLGTPGAVKNNKPRKKTKRHGNKRAPGTKPKGW
jgi:hypothetical protein